LKQGIEKMLLIYRERIEKVITPDGKTTRLIATQL